MSIRSLAALLSVVVFAACGSSTGPDELEGAVLTVEAPARVAVGEPFVVTVTTQGANGCWSRARTEVQVQGFEVDIRPYDRTEAAICTQALVEIPHTAELTFSEAGTVRVSVFGQLRTQVIVE